MAKPRPPPRPTRGDKPPDCLGFRPHSACLCLSSSRQVRRAPGLCRLPRPRRGCQGSPSLTAPYPAKLISALATSVWSSSSMTA